MAMQKIRALSTIIKKKKFLTKQESTPMKTTKSLGIRNRKNPLRFY